MIKLSIPGFKENLSIKHLVLDFNGTLAIDGKLIKGVKPALTALAKSLQIHILTGDTHGSAKRELKDVPCEVTLLSQTNMAAQKEKHIKKLDAATVISIGNGRNDRLMLKASAIGIIVVQKEGAATETLMAADIVCPDIIAALGILSKPLRLRSTLKN